MREAPTRRGLPLAPVCRVTTKPDLRPEYLESTYRAHLGPDHEVLLHHGQLHPRLDEWIADVHPEFRNWVLITAWNPDSKPRSREQNDAAQERLRAELRLRSWPFVEAVGELGDWREESLLVLVPSTEDALDLGLRYGQVAVLLGCRAELAEVTLCSRAGNTQPLQPQVALTD